MKVILSLLIAPSVLIVANENNPLLGKRREKVMSSSGRDIQNVLTNDVDSQGNRELPIDLNINLGDSELFPLDVNININDEPDFYGDEAIDLNSPSDSSSDDMKYGTRSINGGVKDDMKDESDCLTQADKFEFYDWDELPSPIKNTFRVLGYRRDIWNSGQEVDSTWEKSWDDLTKIERKAAEFLRFDQPSWGSEWRSQLDTCLTVVDKYDFYKWDELPADVKQAYKDLDYNERIWENDGVADSSQKWWKQFTPKQREAAEFLGYTRKTWNDVNDDADFPSNRERRAVAGMF